MRIARFPTLLISVGARVCAIPVGHVVETMRPLPIEPVAGAPPFVLGLSIIRGKTVPVVSVARLVGGDEAPRPRRFVVVRVDARRVALAVDDVDGVAMLDGARLESMPPLLEHLGRDVIEAVAPHDERLLMVLRASRLVPEGELSR